MPNATILVADDDKTTLSILGAGLRHEGYQVITAMDTMQVVMAAHRQHPDAIVLDVLMPGGGGHGALKQLKAATTTQSIPVIAISTSTDPALPAKVREEGAVAFLAKPVHFPDLRDLLVHLLGPDIVRPET